jgi:Domain of unknown function (DUF4407)
MLVRPRDVAASSPSSPISPLAITLPMEICYTSPTNCTRLTGARQPGPDIGPTDNLTIIEVVLGKGNTALGGVLIWLSGASGRVLDECPTDRGRYIGIGTAILVTATMAGVSLCFALVTALKVPLHLAVPFAVAWGIAILSLDRLFVVSLPRKGTRWAHVLRAVPRVLLALLIGFVISTPFVLQIFRPEIEHEITVLHAQQEQAYLASQQRSKLQQEITSDRKLSDQLATQEGGGTAPTPPQDQQITRLTGELSQAEAQQGAAQQQEAADSTQVSCQLYGHAPNSNCSGFTNTGQGTVASDDEAQLKAAKNQYQEATDTVNQLEGQIGGLRIQAAQFISNSEKSTAASAKAQLPQVAARLQTEINTQNAEMATFTSQNDNNGGLLIRMEALGALTAGNSTLEAARWLLFALFVAIDIMPVLVKVLLNLGPESNYDRLLDAEEKKQLRVAASNRAVRQAAERMAADVVLGEAESRLAGWRQPIPEVTDNIVAARRRVEARRLTDWENYQAHHPFDPSTGASGSFPTAAEAPVGFIAWPRVTQAPRRRAYRWRPALAMRNLGLRARHAATTGWRFLGRLGRPQPGPGPAAGGRAYGAPYSPGMGNASNGASPSSQVSNSP